MLNEAQSGFGQKNKMIWLRPNLIGKIKKL